MMGRDFLPEEGVAGKDHVVILVATWWYLLERAYQRPGCIVAGKTT
jgi:hypothetical protein